MFQLQNGLKFIKGVRLRKSKRESKEGGGGGGEVGGSGGVFTPDIRVLLPRHFYNSLSVCLFLEFELQLGKSEKLNNQEMKGNRDFRILFIPKKTIKNQTDFAWNFLEIPIQSVQHLCTLFLYFNTPFFSFSKIS